MNETGASELVKKVFGRFGTFMGGSSKTGYHFGLGADKITVFGDGRVFLGAELVHPVTEPPKEEPPEDSTVLLAMIGMGKSIHLAVETMVGYATACNPNKTEYPSGAKVRTFDGDISQVTCKVCGWVLQKNTKVQNG